MSKNRRIFTGSNLCVLLRKVIGSSYTALSTMIILFNTKCLSMLCIGYYNELRFFIFLLLLMMMMKYDDDDDDDDDDDVDEI